MSRSRLIHLRSAFLEAATWAVVVACAGFIWQDLTSAIRFPETPLGIETASEFLGPSPGILTAWDCARPIEVFVNVGRLPQDQSREALDAVDGALNEISHHSRYEFADIVKSMTIPSREFFTRQDSLRRDGVIYIYFGHSPDSDLMPSEFEVARGGIRADPRRADRPRTDTCWSISMNLSNLLPETGIRHLVA